MSQKITYELTVQNGGDLTGAQLEVTRNSQYYSGKLTFKVTECIHKSDDTQVYLLEETTKG